MKKLPGLVTACNILSKYRDIVSKNVTKYLSFVLKYIQCYLLQRIRLLPRSTHTQFMRNSYQIPTATFLEFYGIWCSTINSLSLLLAETASAFRNFPAGPYQSSVNNKLYISPMVSSNIDVIHFINWIF